MYTHMYTYTHVHTNLHICTYVHKHMYTHRCTPHICTHTHTHTHTSNGRYFSLFEHEIFIIIRVVSTRVVRVTPSGTIDQDDLQGREMEVWFKKGQPSLM